MLLSPQAQPGHHVVRPKLIEALQGAGITQLAACGSHTLALSSSGTVYSWGCGQYGRLGHGDEEDCYVPRPINGLHRATGECGCGRPLPSASLCLRTRRHPSYCGRSPLTRSCQSLFSLYRCTTTAADIAAGGFHSAAVTEEGRVVTWGGGCANSYLAADDDQGALASRLQQRFVDACIRCPSFLTPTPTAGGEHGQLGNGQSSNTSTPQVLPLPQNVNQIVCGWSHTLMLTDAGDVWATGNGDHHKIPTATSVPLQVRAEAMLWRWCPLFFTFARHDLDRHALILHRSSRSSHPIQVGPLRGLPVTAMATYNEHVVFLTAPCGG